LAPPDDNDHDCGWKAYAKAQDAKLATLIEKIAELEKRLAGHKSERRKSKLPPPIPAPKSTPADVAKKREAASTLRAAKVETEVVPTPVAPEECRCAKCGSTELRSIGEGKKSEVYEYVHAHFRRKIFQRETLACRCGNIITAKAPVRVGEKTRYAPSFVAHLIVSKCGDSIPQYRLEKAYRNIGIPMSRSTMCDLLHRGARELSPIYAAALAKVPESPDVNADETSVRQIGLGKRAFFWAFITKDLAVYRYATSRSGKTPSTVLGDSGGRLVVDQFTGYNDVSKPGRRLRAGCLAHARRKLFEQREHPETEEALDLIGQIYVVEREAKSLNIVGTEAHLELRRTRSRPLFARLLWWGHRHRRRFEPRSAMRRAINYLLDNFRELGRFLHFATIAPDNNVAEAALRRVALGRSNFLFIGNEQAGHDFAVLYTLVASCEKHGVNAIDYLTDVLTRVQTHPAKKIDELLPHRWKPPPARDR